MKATTLLGDLVPIPDCDIIIPISGINQCAGCDPGCNSPEGFKICMRILPEITDSRSTQYQDTAVVGRSFPIKTFNHGENRTITMKVHFVILKAQDAIDNLKALRALQSATYPRESGKSPYLPPPVCKIRCGHILAGHQFMKNGQINPTNANDGYLCVILKQYSVNFPPDVAWYQSDLYPTLYLPYKFEVDLTWEVVYAAEDLPGQQMIFGDI